MSDHLHMDDRARTPWVTSVTDVEPSARAAIYADGAENDRVDHDFGLLARVGLVVEVAQEVLGHANVSTTARSYARVDEAAMVTALAAAREALDATGAIAGAGQAGPPGGAGYVFTYDAATLAELEQAAGGQRDGL